MAYLETKEKNISTVSCKYLHATCNLKAIKVTKLNSRPWKKVLRIPISDDIYFGRYCFWRLVYVETILLLWERGAHVQHKHNYAFPDIPYSKNSMINTLPVGKTNFYKACSMPERSVKKKKKSHTNQYAYTANSLSLEGWDGIHGIFLRSMAHRPGKGCSFRKQISPFNVWLSCEDMALQSHCSCPYYLLPSFCRKWVFFFSHLSRFLEQHISA